MKNTFTTRFGIGEEVYFVERSSFGDYYKVEKGTIDRLNFGGKAFEQYQIGNHTFSERNLYKDVDVAKQAAKEAAEERYKKNIEIIDEQRVNELSN